MTRLAFATLFAATCLTVSAQEKKPSALGGAWTVTSIVKEGKENKEEVGKAKFTFAGDKVTLTFGARDEPALFAIDPKAEPATIDIRLLDKDGKPRTRGGKEQVIKGIYKLEKGVLTMCVALDDDPAGVRPKEFKAEKTNVLFTLEKVKK